MVCAKYLSSKQKYDDQCFSKSNGGTEKERLGGGREGDLVRKCGCHRKSESLPGQYCANIHIPNELHSSNLFSEP